MSETQQAFKDWWDRTEPVERDARVALAMGCAPREKCRSCGHGLSDHRGGGLCELCIPAWDTTGRDSGCQAFKAPVFPPYSGSWDYAGPLLAELTARGWERVSLDLYDDHSGNLSLWRVFDAVDPTIHVELERREIPEVIALAFCLANLAEAK